MAEKGARRALSTDGRDAPPVHRLWGDGVRGTRSTDELLLMRTAFEAAANAILITDRAGKIEWANPAFTRLTGYAPEEVVGSTPRILSSGCHDPDYYRRLWEAILAGEVWHDEVVNRRKDGSLYMEEQTITPVRRNGGRVTHFIAIKQDVTPRKRAEEERKRLQAELEHRAMHDWLTGLPNLPLFRDRLERAVAHAQRTGGDVALLFLDLDGFKDVNDAFGHAAGDRLLVQTAHRLAGSVREVDTVARIGGDEFTLILEGLAGKAALEEPLQRLLLGLRAPFTVEGNTIEVRASVGVALHHGLRNGGGKPADLAEELIRRADAAMYRAKRKPGAEYHIFDPRTDSDRRGLVEQMMSLRRAIRRNEIVPFYQPLVDLETGRLRGVESLARWIHPDRGTLPPAQFIALAEESGLIMPLGELLLEMACRDMAGWLGRLPDGTSLRLLANVSGRQLEDPALAAKVHGVLERTGLHPASLQLEITETSVMQNVDQVDRLKELGVTVTVDDFGTGYSSFRYLKDLRAHALKIDMSFIRGLGRDSESLAIVKAMVTLAHTLGLTVMAEGIETEEQRRLLRELGCHLGQGFLFSPALSAGEIEELIRRDTVW